MYLKNSLDRETLFFQQASLLESVPIQADLHISNDMHEGLALSPSVHVIQYKGTKLSEN